MTLQCPANFLHFLQSEKIGSPDGDPIKREITIIYDPIETKAVFFCGKFSMMRKHLMIFLFSRTVESHI